FSGVFARRQAARTSSAIQTNRQSACRTQCAATSAEIGETSGRRVDRGNHRNGFDCVLASQQGARRGGRAKANRRRYEKERGEAEERCDRCRKRSVAATRYRPGPKRKSSCGRKGSIATTRYRAGPKRKGSRGREGSRRCEAGRRIRSIYRSNWPR